MTDTPETTTTPQDAPVGDVEPLEPPASATDTPAPEEPAGAPDADYIAQLKDEAIRNRHKAKKVDTANERLLAQALTADGRLVDPTAIPLGAELLDDDGLVDPAKVHAAVDALVTAKPWLRKQVPATPLPGMGVNTAPAPPAPGLFDVLLGR